MLETARPAAVPVEGCVAVQCRETTEKWIEHDDEARGTIGLTADEEQIGHVRATKSAKEAWDF